MDRPTPSPLATDPGPNLRIETIDRRLYNRDLAPIEGHARRWGWFEIWNVWSNAAQSLFGYTLAASLFLTYGLNGWAVFAAITLAGVIVMGLVNLSGRPSVKYGIPYPVMARASMGVYGANFPAMIRGTVAIFWYGAQTYIASTAIALLITSLGGGAIGDGTRFLGLTTVGWISFVIAWSFQVALFWRGIEWLRTFLNWAGPGVYAVMIALMAILWVRAGSGLLSEVGRIFQGAGTYSGGPFAAFMTVLGTMITYYSAVILNYGDFSRYVRTQADMKKGNLLGLPLNMAFFAFIALFVTGGTAVVFGARLTNPTEIVGRVGSLPLTIIAALTFVAATVGINVVSNFVPPANDLSNLLPSRISFRTGGIITAIVAFFVGALYVSIIDRFGIARFVNTLGAVLAPAYGVMIADYYLLKRQELDIQALFSSSAEGAYHYGRGWNGKGVVAIVVAAIFSVLAVWLPALGFLAGYDWIIGAVLGGAIYFALMGKASRRDT